MIKLSYIFIILFFLIVLRNINADCSFEYIEDFPTIPSVLLTNRSTLLEPKHDPIRLSFMERIIVACPGSNNYIEQLNKPYDTAICVHGKNLNISGRTYQLSALGCKTRVQSDCQNTSLSCGNRKTGVLVDIGYKITHNINPILTLFQICYDYKDEVPLYAQHKLYGKTICLARSSTVRSFKIGCLPLLFTQRDLDNAYKQESQLKRFTEILSSHELANSYFQKHKSFLAKGHLNPDGDQVFKTSTTATYLYINTVPMWQQVNNGNWKSLEISIRNYAQKTKNNFEILTGGHDVLKLPDIYGVEKEIYLTDFNELAVPKYLWKVIYSKRTGSAMGFIALNNPFDSHATLPCTNICNEYDWGTNLWTNYTRGLLYCCSMRELVQIIPQIPKSFSVIDFTLRGFD